LTDITITDASEKSVTVHLRSHTNSFSTLEGHLGRIPDSSGENHRYQGISGIDNDGTLFVPLNQISRITFTNQDTPYPATGTMITWEEQWVLTPGGRTYASGEYRPKDGREVTVTKANGKQFVLKNADIRGEASVMQGEAVTTLRWEDITHILFKHPGGRATETDGPNSTVTLASGKKVDVACKLYSIWFTGITPDGFVVNLASDDTVEVRFHK
jgi:hypothetical protein